MLGDSAIVVLVVKARWRKRISCVEPETKFSTFTVSSALFVNEDSIPGNRSAFFFFLCWISSLFFSVGIFNVATFFDSPRNFEIKGENSRAKGTKSQNIVPWEGALPVKKAQVPQVRASFFFKGTRGDELDWNLDKILGRLLRFFLLISNFAR